MILMRNTTLSTSLKALVLAGASSLWFTGCVTSNSDTASGSDGTGSYLAAETDQMGQVYGQLPTGAAAKSAGLLTGVTITGELVIEPFAYHDSCACFVRKANFTGMRGYERERIDSVTLLDSTGATMNHFNRALASKIIHKRNVTHTKGAHEVDVRIEVTVDIKTEAGARVGVWNGTMSGSFDGQAFKSGTIDKVTRAWDGQRFGFPESGTIEIDRPVLHFLLEFTGDDKAKLTVTNKVTKVVRIYLIDRNYTETQPAT